MIHVDSVAVQKVRPGLWKLFITWLSIGLQSFGGGSSTLFLINQASQKQNWLSDEEFVRVWALVQVSPGINLVKLSMLIGHRLRGWPGLIVCTAGMLIPSAVVTVLMTAGFAVVRSQPLVQAAMRGVLPATIGLGMAMAVQLARPLLSDGYKEGPIRLGAHLFILSAAALLMAQGQVSPVMVLLLSGAAGILLLALLPVRGKTPEGTARP
jgi:chromate transporter